LLFLLAASLHKKWCNQSIFLSVFGAKQPFYFYAKRLRSDLQAIKHAFLLPYSNGVLEGQINRLKTIKRMMYGRAGLDLLEKRGSL